MLCVGHASVNPLIASYMKHLDTSAQLAGFLAGMFFGVSFLLKPFTGHALTKLDKRKLLIFVFALGALANLGYALFHSVPMFMVFRFVSGVQYGFVGPLIVTLAADNLPKENMAYGVGLYGIGGAIGNAIGPWIGESILQSGTALRGEGFGFTLMFLFGALIFILATIPTIIIGPDMRTREDMASISIWYKNIFTIHALPPTIILFFVMISYAIINTYIFEFGKEQGIAGVSVFFLVLALALSVSRPLSGYLTDKLGVRRIMLPALIIFAAAMLVIGSSQTLWMLLIGAVLAAVGFGSSQPALQAMSMQSETALRRGIASNTLYMGIDMGLFLGPYIGGLIYSQSDYATMFKFGMAPVGLAINSRPAHIQTAYDGD
jgi:MFS family permease